MGAYGKSSTHFLKETWWITLNEGPGGLEGHVSKWKTWIFGGLHRRQNGKPAGCRKGQPFDLPFSAVQLNVQPASPAFRAARRKFMFFIWKQGLPARLALCLVLSKLDVSGDPREHQSPVAPPAPVPGCGQRKRCQHIGLCARDNTKLRAGWAGKSYFQLKNMNFLTGRQDAKQGGLMGWPTLMCSPSACPNVTVQSTRSPAHSFLQPASQPKFMFFNWKHGPPAHWPFV